MNLLTNIKVFTEKCCNLKSSENIIDKLDAGIGKLDAGIYELDAGISQLTKILDARLCRQQQNASLMERPKTTEKT